MSTLNYKQLLRGPPLTAQQKVDCWRNGINQTNKSSRDILSLLVPDRTREELITDDAMGAIISNSPCSDDNEIDLSPSDLVRMLKHLDEKHRDPLPSNLLWAWTQLKVDMNTVVKKKQISCFAREYKFRLTTTKDIQQLVDPCVKSKDRDMDIPTIRSLLELCGGRDVTMEDASLVQKRMEAIAAKLARSRDSRPRTCDPDIASESVFEWWWSWRGHCHEIVLGRQPDAPSRDYSMPRGSSLDAQHHHSPTCEQQNLANASSSPRQSRSSSSASDDTAPVKQPWSMGWLGGGPLQADDGVGGIWSMVEHVVSMCEMVEFNSKQSA